MRNPDPIQQAIEILKNGGLVGLPTETVYGLAGAYNAPEAIEKIFTLKERPSFDPLIVHISELSQVSTLAQKWSETENILAKAFWPGPVTLVTEKSKNVSDRITAGLSTVGIRMPAHPIAREVIQRLGVPLAAPSANKFGKTSPTRAEHVRKEFGEALFVLDGGDSEVGIESTVIRVEESSSEILIKVLRPGVITGSSISEAIQSASTKPIRVLQEASVSSPGHSETHYQPPIPLVILSRTPSQDQVTTIEKRFSLPAFSRFSELNLNADPRLAARDLYAKMREISESGSKWMFVRRSLERQGEIWNSLWNRIEKASSLRLESSQ